MTMKTVIIASIVTSTLFIGLCAWLANKAVQHDEKCRKAAISRGNGWAPYIGEYSKDTTGLTVDTTDNSSNDADNTAIITAITVINLGTI